MTLVGTVSSCADKDFDWDDAHAKTMHDKFTNTFIKAFGTPADNHQWGFDYAQFAMEGPSNMGTNTRANASDFLGLVKDYYKMDFNFDALPGQPKVYEAFDIPNDITKHEHDEVYAWFTNHQVIWAHTPEYLNTNTSRNSLNPSTNIEETKIYAKELSTDYAAAGYGSLIQVSNYQTVNHVGATYIEDVDINFFNGWLQNVARDDEKTRALLTQPADSAYEDCIIKDGQHKYDGQNMDYMAFRSLVDKEKWVHANDFNGGRGYGWGRQPSNDEGGKYHEYDYYDRGGDQNAGLILNADFNVVTYGCTVDGSLPHCKYYIVHLKGDDYEGYYLGLDLEGYAPVESNENNKKVKADGICNDWIIKISDAGTIGYNPARIMCEDLGGENNTVTIGTTVHVSDIDYNDIVIDVDNVANKDIVSITLKAAGGTLPLIVTYEDDVLFETHEFFELKKPYSQVTTSDRQNVDYGKMWNTDAETNPGTSTDVLTYKLFFGNETPSSSETAPYKRETGKKFSLNNLHIKVYRHKLEDYLFSSNFSPAEWLTLGNIKGSAPLKICVPQTVKWLKERHAISDGYKNFKDWVAAPKKPFWKEFGYYDNDLNQYIEVPLNIDENHLKQVN